MNEINNDDTLVNKNELSRDENENKNEKTHKKDLDTCNNEKNPKKYKSSNPTNLKSKNIPFWSENPNVLFQQPYVSEFFPVNGMTYEQKLNALTRLVIILTLLTFLYTNSTRLLAVSAITILAIFLLFYSKHVLKKESMTEQKRVRFHNTVEGFTTDINGVQRPVIQSIQQAGLEIPDELYVKPISQNPLGNVLLTDYDYNPNKDPAPPSYTENIGNEILSQAKQMVINSNPGQPDIANKLFSDLGDELNFEQSMRPFYSTANTTIPNDQSGFADFCYGSMVSCKEGNMFACSRNNGSRYNNY